MPQSPTYQPVNESENYSEKSTFRDNESEQESEPYIISNSQRRWEQRKLLLMTYFNLFLFMISMLILVCVTFWRPSPTPSSASASIIQGMRDFGIWSPAIDVVKYKHTQFHMPVPLNASKYVGVGPEVDEEWNMISFVPDSFITPAELKKLHKPPTSLAAPDPMTGAPGYRVGLEVFHQLHCLNLLRQATHPDYYSKLGGDLSESAIKIRGHLDHCIEALRLNIQCHGDIHAFTFHDKPGKKGDPWPDYDSHRVCVDFESLLDWQWEMGLEFTSA